MGASSVAIVSRIMEFYPSEEWEDRVRPRTETAAAAAPRLPRTPRAPATNTTTAAAATQVETVEAPEPNGAVTTEAPKDEAGLASRLDDLFRQ